MEMDRSADLEMPSPKRIRLEAQEPEAPVDLATPFDDIDHSYGTLLVQPHGPSESSHFSAPALGTPAFPDQKLFQLPGLGMLDEDPAFSFQTSQQQSQPSFFSEAEQSSSIRSVKDPEQANGQKLQVNGGLGSTVDDERMVNTQAAETERISPFPSKILADSDATAVASPEERVLEAEAPIDRDVTRSGSELAQSALDWHSSGTIIDNVIWLGGYSVEKTPTTAPDSSTASAGTNAGVLQEKGAKQIRESSQEGLFSGTKLVAEWNETKISEKPAFEDLAEANKDTEEAEFELDSSPLGSDSSSDDSADTTSSDDSDVDDYEMLSPAEQARRLMAEDGGSDGDGKGKGRSAIAEVPRTLNEKLDEFVPKPTVTITEDMKIEELGPVENIVENLVLIKANISGEYQVLESGSLLCLQDRSAIGVVSETLGRVQQPYYSVRFTNVTAIAEAGIGKGIKIFYVAQHSTTVFTQPLKAFRGSDASNLHDEEVGDDELEFSDDEAEAEHKRRVKQQRLVKRNARDGQPDGYSRGPQQRPGGPSPRLDGGLQPVQEHPPTSAEVALNYDDADCMNVEDREDEDGLYTPLARPSNLHELLSVQAPPMNNHRGRGDTNRGRDDSRGGNRGRGGKRGMRSSERGGKQNRNDHGHRGGKGQAYGHLIPPAPQTNGFNPSQPNGLPPRPSHETIGYRQATHPGNGSPYPPPQQSPVPSRAYQTQQQQSQFHTHPGYPSQYPNVYNQSYFQQPPHPTYPSHVPPQNYSQYHQPQPSVPHPGYVQQFALQPDTSFAPRPQHPGSIAPGAHINPNFFKQQGQSSSPQAWQQGYNQQQQGHLASPASGRTGPPAPVTNEARLHELLKGLGNGSG